MNYNIISCDDHLDMQFLPPDLWMSRLALGDTLTDIEMEAIAYVIEVCDRPEMGLLIELKRGEAVFINNFEVLHSRQSFTEWEDPAKARHLLRLWIEAESPRPLPSEMLVWHNPSHLQGIDPFPTDAASVALLAERAGSSINKAMRECIAKVQMDLEQKRRETERVEDQSL